MYTCVIYHFFFFSKFIRFYFYSIPQCSSVCEFVRHHLSSGSVCDPRTNKWHSISNITYAVTSDPTSHVKLWQSFMKHFAVIHWQQYR